MYLNVLFSGKPASGTPRESAPPAGSFVTRSLNRLHHDAESYSIAGHAAVENR
jgi:hypothetical protein